MSIVEEEAIQQIAKVYKGKYISSKGIEVEGKKQIQYFEIIVHKSGLQKNIKYHSSNIAYIFHSNLKDQKKKYVEIRIKIYLDESNYQNYTFTEEQLNEVENLKPYFDKINKEIVEKNYGNLLHLFDNSISVDLEMTNRLFSSYEKNYGNIQSILLQGFEFNEAEIYGKVILINQILVYERINLPVILIVKRNTGKLISIELPPS